MYSAKYYGIRSKSPQGSGKEAVLHIKKGKGKYYLRGNSLRLIFDERNKKTLLSSGLNQY